MEDIAISHLTKAAPPPPIPDSGDAGDFIEGKKFSMIAIFFLFLDSMTSRQNTVIVQAKQIEKNASIQDALNKAAGDFKLVLLPSKAGTVTVNNVMIENEQLGADRAHIQNRLITERQKGQIIMTESSTTVNILQQDAAQDSGWLQMLNTMYQQIVDMTQH